LEFVAEEINILCEKCGFTSSLFHDSLIECNSATPGDAIFRTQLLAKPGIPTSMAMNLMEAWVLGTTFLEDMTAMCREPICFDPAPETTTLNETTVESSALPKVTTVLIYIITFVIALPT
jgi:hypothetical protein